MLAPVSRRIVKDHFRCLGLNSIVLAAIVEAGGTAVHFDGERTGRRAEGHYEKKPPKSVKEMLERGLHPDAKEAGVESVMELMAEEESSDDDDDDDSSVASDDMAFSDGG